MQKEIARNLKIPVKLKQNDKVLLFAPSFRCSKEQINLAIKNCEALQLDPIFAQNLNAADSYFSMSIEDSVKAINSAFSSSDIKALIAIRGGFGSARLLPYLDYQLLAKNPKPILGYSDLTAILIAIYVKTNLVTYHGVNFGYELSNYCIESFKSNFLQDTKKHNLKLQQDFFTITSGVIEGILIGGNLSVFCSLLGTEFLPKYWDDKILFLEDIGEDVYRIERYLLQLELAGILQKIKGIILGRFTKITANKEKSYSLPQIFVNYFAKLKIPVCYNAQFGHCQNIITLPIGIPVIFNSDTGIISYLK